MWRMLDFGKMTQTQYKHMLNTDEVIIFVPMCDPRAQDDTQTNEAC